MDDGSSDDLSGWIGRSKVAEDEVTRPALRRIAAMLDLPDRLAPGEPIPPHWVAMFFPEIAPQSGLGADGHPARGDFLPPVPLPRRMFAGRRVRFTGALHVGDVARKRSEVVAITPKTGRSGAMVFVTIRHVVSVGEREVAVEEQDVVYRELPAPGAALAPPFPPPADAAWSETMLPTPVLLFRYSAITFNGHRIHYDANYARGEENYPDCVVNGGLTLLLLLEAVLRRVGGTLAAVSVRNQRPLFVDRLVTLAGMSVQDGGATAWATDDTHALAVMAECVLV